MTDATAIALVALMVSGATFAMQFHQWFESGPVLRLRVMRDAVAFPHDDGVPKFAITVANRGRMPTTLTHFIAFIYPTIFHRIIGKPARAAIITNRQIPYKLELGATWTTWANYHEEYTTAREKGQAFVGFYASDRNRPYLCRIPRKAFVREVDNEAAE